MIFVSPPKFRIGLGGVDTVQGRTLGCHRRVFIHLHFSLCYSDIRRCWWKNVVRMVNDYIIKNCVCVLFCSCVCVCVCCGLYLVLCNNFGSDLEIVTHHPVPSLRFSQLKTLQIDAKGRQAFHLLFGFRLSWQVLKRSSFQGLYHCVTLIVSMHGIYYVYLSIYIYIYTCTSTIKFNHFM